MPALRPVTVGSSLALALVLVFSTIALAGPPSSPAGLVPVIVVFEADVADPAGLTSQLSRSHGFTARHVYGAALKGFSASVPSRAVAALAGHPRVSLVEREVVETIADDGLPTGIDRIEADKNPSAGIDSTSGPDLEYHVAIVDTGISAHSDLRLGPGASFAGGDSSDGNGHGTHVAGTVAARDNGSGVVGVAPGAWVHPVKVCKNGGICMSGDIIAGINWVADRKAEHNDGNADGDPGIDFASANFSISSSDTTSSCNANGSGANATHTAICGVVGTGVVFAMAAGNDGREKDAYPEAFTVAAIADFDGKGGGVGAPTCRTDVDETLADFSNWSDPDSDPADVDIAAPGTCILSTWNDGGYKTISGTSMATPHVTGAVALYLHANNKSPAQNKTGVQTIENAILAAALPEGTENDSCSYNSERGSNEPLLFVNAAAFGGNGSCDLASAEEPNSAPTVSITEPADNSTFDSGASITFAGTASDNEDGDVTAGLVWTSSLDGQIGTGGSFSATLSDGTHTVTAEATDADGASGSDSITVVIGSQGTGGTLNVEVSTDKPSYVNHETVQITVNVTDATGPTSAAAVHVEVTTANGRVHVFDGTTDADGAATFSLKVNTKRDGSGEFVVDATATKAGFTSGSGSTWFTVN